MAERRFSAPDLADAVEAWVGPYRLALVYRRVTGDEGPTVHVFGPVEGEEREILRFDCFRNDPHFHLGIDYRDEPVQPIAAVEPLTWVLEELGSRFPDYLERSHAGSELPDDWRAQAERAVESLRAQAGAAAG